MKTNTATRVKQSAGTSQAGASVKADRRDEEATPPTMSPEEFRLSKIDEALAVRANIERLRAAANDRYREERKRA